MYKHPEVVGISHFGQNMFVRIFLTFRRSIYSRMTIIIYLQFCIHVYIYMYIYIYIGNNICMYVTVCACVLLRSYHWRKNGIEAN